MADKILQTRIISKHTTYDLAKDSSFTPMEGEIVLVRVDTAKPDGHGGVVTVPTYLMKVGAKDSSGNLIALKDLKWTHAPASDVYEWAKAVKLNINDANTVEVASLSSAVFADIKAAIDAKVATTDFDAYKNTVAQNIATLEQSISDLSGNATSTYATKDELKAVSDVADANAEAITAINDTESGILATANSAADAKVLAEKNRAEGAEAALDGRVDTLETDVAAIKNAETGILATAKGYTDTEVSKATTAASNAQSAADKAQEEVDALELTVSGNYNTLSGAIGDEKTARETADTSIRTDFASADSQIRADFEAEDTKIRKAFADADSALDTKISTNATNILAEKNRAEAAEGALSGRVTTVENKLKDVTNVMDFVGAVEALPAEGSNQDGDVVVVTAGDNAGKEFVYDSSRDTGKKWVEFGSTTATDAALGDLTSRVGDLETNKANAADLTAEENARKAADATLQGNIDTLSGTVTDNKDEFDSYKTSNDNRVKAVEDKNASQDTTISGIDNRVAGIEADYLKAVDKYDDTEVRGLISDEADAREGADTALGERIDGLSTTVTNNKTAYDAYVTENNGKVNKISGDLSELSTKVNGIDEAYKSADATLTSNLNGVSGRVTTLEGEMDDVQAAVATKAEQTAVNGIDNRVSAVESNYVKVSGSNLVTQAGDVIIFDCGGVE